MRWVQAFEATLESPAQAREFVASIAHGFQAAEIEDDARLMVSELVTNAVIHSAARFTLVVDRDDERLHVEVYDNRPDETLAPHPVPEPNAFSGHGRNIVEALADRWGVQSTPSGAAVWFELEGDLSTRSTSRAASRPTTVDPMGSCR